MAKPTVAIIGKPNVGKSSLINKILGEKRTIVSNIAGTTRDAIDTPFENEHGKYVLIDTAGIRKTNDVVESIGVQKSLQYIDKADLVLYLINNNEEITKENLDILEKIKEIRADLKLTLKLEDASAEDVANALRGIYARGVCFEQARRKECDKITVRQRRE